MNNTHAHGDLSPRGIETRQENAEVNVMEGVIDAELGEVTEEEWDASHLPEFAVV